MKFYEVFVSVDGRKGVVRVSGSLPPIRNGSTSTINYALDLTQSCYPDSKVDFLYVKEYYLEDEPDVGYIYEPDDIVQTYH